MKYYLTLCLFLYAAIANAVNLQISKDSDYYLYYGSYNETRTPLYIGVNDLTTGSTYQYHFNFASIEISDIDNFNIGNTGLLRLNLQRFRIPVNVDPSYIGPPSYNYVNSGVSFSIKAVKLTDNFSNLLNDSNPLDWYTTNLLNRPAIDEVSFNQAGEIVFDITEALNEWKIDPLTNFGIGLVGTYSSVTGATAQFYSLEFNDPLLTPNILIIPEPTIVEFLIAFIFVILVIRLFKKE